MTADFLVAYDGSLSLVTPVTPAAREWVEHHVPEDASWFGPSLAVEWRYVDSLLEGIEDDGLPIREET